MAPSRKKPENNPFIRRRDAYGKKQEQLVKDRTHQSFALFNILLLEQKLSIQV